ncbi:MAG TPA: protein kinase [Polyangiaceae bacterium]|nr:protein kinase [Polyangiaceae bacterium]
MVVEERPLSAEDCAIGEVVAGKYLVEGVIGRGSMGVVVRATHLGFDELVALKFIRPEMRKLDGIVSRFAREAKASVRIRNEHAVNVLDVGVADPVGPFFVMEYLEGINLEELVDSQGPFDPATAAKYVLEACEALAAAHAQGIIHRDIKPQNMFLAWQGRLELIKILDFGISKAALSGQVFGDDLSNGDQDWVMGTPLYMSPEQLRHAPDVDERTDIWSLGAVLYELLVGQPLFSGDTQTAVCRQVFEVGQRPLRVDVAGVSDTLWDIVERCLSPDKEQRFANVAELGQALLPFAPPAAVLHVERARALLGLERLDFLAFDEHIEEIDAEPIEDDEAPAAVMPLVASKPDAARRPHWVEVALPVLACAVVWIGYRQWQLSQDSSVVRSEEAIQTVALALQRAELRPAAGIDGRPQSFAATRADCPVPNADARGAGSELDTAPVAGAVAATPSARPDPSSSVVPGVTDGTQSSPPPLAAQHASGVRRASAPTARPPVREPASSATPAPATPRADVPVEAARRPLPKAKPKVDAKPQFRLIEEDPRPDLDLVPNGAGASAPAAPSPAAPSPAAPSPR